MGKIIGQVGQNGLDKLGKTRQSLRQEAYEALTAHRTSAPAPNDKPASARQAKASPLPEGTLYVLDPGKKFLPKAKASRAA